MTYAPGVVSDLLDAVIRSARTFHRLEHLGRRGPTSTLKEETITDLLLAELQGREFEVVGRCPRCGRDCPDWTGSPRRSMRVRAKALTKYQEGGNIAHGKAPTGADFVLAMRGADEREVLMFVQAKRAVIGEKSLVDEVQYRALLRAAADHHAVPLYAFYVQQPDAHTSTGTRCSRHVSAAERSIVLVAAGEPGTAEYLPGLDIPALLSRGLPLRCLGGCPTVGSTERAPVVERADAFVRALDPDVRPRESVDRADDGAPRDVPGGAAVVFDDGAWRIGRVDAAEDQVLVVRLGAQAVAEEPDRAFIGWGPGMTRDQVRDAARMWWKLNQERAARVRHLVAVAEGEVVGAYDVVADPRSESFGGGHRIAFEVVDAEPRRSAELSALVAARPAKSGARNPVRYLRLG